jgi:hypothetical protein
MVYFRSSVEPVSSEKDRLVRERSDMNADSLFAEIPPGIEAAIAELQAELLFAFRTEAAKALVAGGIFRELVLLLNVNFGMGFERIHKMPHKMYGQGRCHTDAYRLAEFKRLTFSMTNHLSDFTQQPREIHCGNAKIVSSLVLEICRVDNFALQQSSLSAGFRAAVWTRPTSFGVASSEMEIADRGRPENPRFHLPAPEPRNCSVPWRRNRDSGSTSSR